MPKSEIDRNVDQNQFFWSRSKSQKMSKVEGKRKVKSDNWKLKTENWKLERTNFETVRQISQIQIDQME
jgi:hypothetical protein